VRKLGQTDSVLIIAFLTLMVFPLLYAHRRLDDNTLTSWRWVFSQGDLIPVLALIALGATAAFFLSRLTLREQDLPLLLFILSSLAVFPLWQAPETILDAGRYVLQAKHLEFYGVSSFFREWGGEVRAWTDLPVVPFFYGVIFRYLGESRLWIQGFTTILFSLSVVITYLTGKALWDRETGFLAGLLLLSSPYLLVQVPLMLVDVPLLFFFALAAYAFLSAIERGGARRTLLAIPAIVLALLSKYSACLMLIVLPVISVVSCLRGNRSAVIRSFLIFGAVGVVVALFILWKEDLLLSQIRLLRDYQWPGLARWKESAFSTFFFQVHPFVLLAAVSGVFFALLRRDIRFLIPAWFVFFIVFFRADRIRYLLPLFPLLALMAGYGLRTMSRDERIGRFAAFCAFTTTLAVVLGGYLPSLNSTSMANLKDAARYIDSLPGQSVVVTVLPQKTSIGNTEMAIPLLDLYTRKRLVYVRTAPARPDETALSTSPLRFTWDIALPAFYDPAGAHPSFPAAIISSDTVTTGLPGSAGARYFSSDSGTFRYRTIVTVVSSAPLADSAQ
jgi:4-amino-4-deoxy-L-arabinose transferase-like glycosyltransferase